jgi:hypothetical protein
MAQQRRTADDAVPASMDESAATALIDAILNGEYDGALWNGLHNELRRDCRNMTSTAVQQNAAKRFAPNGGDRLERTRDYLQRAMVILCTRNIVQHMNASDDDDVNDADDTENENGDAAGMPLSASTLQDDNDVPTAAVPGDVAAAADNRPLSPSPASGSLR